MCVSITASAQETLLLRHPSVSNNKIAFAYGGDIWTSDRDGSHLQRITINPGVETNPMLSPDGKWIAFTGNYDGNNDVYVVAASGGTPKRLTYHPANDIVRSWHGNDKVVFETTRSWHFFANNLYEVDIATGIETMLAMPEASQGSISPDGKYTAYIKTPDINDWACFRLYRGGNMTRIWIFNNQTHDIEEIPAAHSNSLMPVWTDNNTIYFLSDRDNHYMNVYKYDLSSKAVTQVTSFRDFDVKTLCGNGNDLAFEQGGKIFLLNAFTNQQTHVPISIQEDMLSKRPYFADADGNIYNVNISPTGVRAVMEVRGEIFTVPLDKGDIRNITNAPSTNERDPAWSPDGKWIAYFSDESGEYTLKLKDQKGEKDAITIKLDSIGFYYHPVWSPDSKKIAYVDKARRLFIVDINEKKPIEIDKDWYTPGTPQINCSWSSDSKWITYNNRVDNHFGAIFLYNVADKKKYQLTDAMSEASYPVFSKDGKYIFFTASTNFGPGEAWLDLTSYDHETRSSIYSIVLSKKTPSILQPKSDEETVTADETKSADTTAKKTAKKDKETKPATDNAKQEDIAIDLDNIQQRIEALPLPAKNTFALNANVDGQLYYLTQEYHAPTATLNAYDIDKRKSDVIMSGINNYYVSNDGKKMLYAANGAYGIVTTNKANVGDGALNTSAIKVYVNPEKEWTQMYNEVWRLERDYLYVKNANGANLEALKKKYAVFLPYVAHRSDLEYLFKNMLGELVLGHVFVGGGDFPKTKNVNVGLLGADYEIANGFYRFKKIYSGLNWNPGITAPLTQPGIDVKDGQYLVAVNGIPLDAKTNIYSLFQNTAGKQIKISVNDAPTMKDAKDFIVVPIANEMGLRRMNWIETNRKIVDSLSNGRIAYVYLPNTADEGYDFFNRYFFAQLNKDAVIADDRYNQGGYAADYIVDLLARKTVMNSNQRDNKPFSIPNAVINGPKIMLTNSTSLSGGDLMPYMFRAKGVGKLVGTTTLGILVGNSLGHQLMDGAYLTSPNIGIFSTDEKWIIEQEGVAPDITVENYPKDLLNGHDAQLEKAIELIMKDLPPHKETKQPADPIRVADY